MVLVTTKMIKRKFDKKVTIRYLFMNDILLVYTVEIAKDFHCIFYVYFFQNIWVSIIARWLEDEKEFFDKDTDNST